jgi:predicted ribosome quality control (RQC) complex YloA/Tae2 family protein
MPLFGKSQKSPVELVKVSRYLSRKIPNRKKIKINLCNQLKALKEALKALEALKTLERGDKKAEKAQEDVSKNLVST